MSSKIHHIIYAEDDTAEIYLWKETLSDLDLCLDIDYACSVEKALAIFNPSRHTLIVTDLNLPDGEAFDIATSIHKLIPSFPIILLSNHYTERQLRQIKLADINHFWHKTSPRESLEKIAAIIQNLGE